MKSIEVENLGNVERQRESSSLFNMEFVCSTTHKHIYTKWKNKHISRN